MRFRKVDPEVELPEKVSVNRFINVRSAQRIDVCPGATVNVNTGLRVIVPKNEKAVIKGEHVVEGPITSGLLFVPIHNPTKRSIMIYRGQVLAEIWVEKLPVKKAASRKKASFTSEAIVKKYEPQED